MLNWDFTIVVESWVVSWIKPYDESYDHAVNGIVLFWCIHMLKNTYHNLRAQNMNFTEIQPTQIISYF